jgi:hypothetical protein
MVKKLTISLFLLALFISLNAVWKYEQEADSNGVDIKYGVLADDWICTETGPIREICFAHSWKNDIEGTIIGIWVYIYDNNAGIPGSLLYSQYKTVWDTYEYTGLEDWYDPYTNTFLADNHNSFYKRKLILNPPFIQTNGTHYWLSIIPIVAGVEEIGWKTSIIDPINRAVYFDTAWELLPYSGLAFKLASTTDEPCPVELSSFTAISTVSSQVELKWVTQSETNLLGYNIMRSNTSNASDAVCCNSNVIPSNNTSTEQIYTYLDSEAQTQSSYWYWLQSVEMDGITDYHGPVFVTTGNPQNPDTPPITVDATILHDAYPNPFGSSTKIAYDLPSPSNVKLEVYNLKGEKVRTLENISRKTGGAFSCTWDGLDDNGKEIPSGIYLYRLQTDNFIQTKSAIFMK